MKYIKLFENFSYGELEDNILELIETGMVEKSETGENFQDIHLVKRSRGGSWVPTDYSVKFKLKMKTVLASIEDLEFNRKIYDKIIDIVYRAGSEFKLSSNDLTLFVKCSDSIKNFYRRWGIGSSMIDLEPNTDQRIISLFAVHKIEDDFSVVFHSWPLRGFSIEEALDFVKPLVENETEYKYNAEVWIEKHENADRIYIRVRP